MAFDAYIKNDYGGYIKLDDINDMPVIDTEPPDGDFGLHFDPNESITLTVDRLPKKSRYALLSWMAKGSMRRRLLRQALRWYGGKW